MLWKTSGKRNERTVVTFYVSDDAAAARASGALSRVKVPLLPQLKTMRAAAKAGESLMVNLSREINIVKKIDASSEDLRRQNQQILDQLCKNKEYLVQVIDRMINPMNSVVTDVVVDLADLKRQVLIIQSQMRFFEIQMKEGFDSVKSNPSQESANIPWMGTLKEAGIEVCELYRVDEGSEIKKYRNLRDASNEFFHSHVFVYEPQTTNDSLYENVKKARGN